MFAVGRFLAPDGVMFPEVARLYACPSSLAAFHCDQLQCWSEPYGLDMTAVADAARASMQHAPQVRRAAAGRRRARRGRSKVGIDAMALVGFGLKRLAMIVIHVRLRRCN